jgi:serine phosphatase RsbU (regulator of sigma subunit)
MPTNQPEQILDNIHYDNAKQLARVDELLKKIDSLREIDPAQGLELLEEACALATHLEYQVAIAQCHYLSGFCNWYLANNKRAVLDCQQALQLYQKLDIAIGEARVLNLLGLIYVDLCDYPTAIEFFRKAITRAANLEASTVPIFAANNIGIVYDRLEQWDTALVYYKQALELANQANDKILMVMCSVNIGAATNSLNQPQQALPYLNRAAEILDTFDNARWLGRNFICLGESYRLLDQPATALTYLEKALPLVLKTELKLLPELLLAFGDAYSQSGNFEQADSYYKQAFEQAELNEVTDMNYLIHKAYFKMYQKQTNFEQALYHYQKYAELKLQMANADNSKAMLAIQMRYDLEGAEREKEIYRLRNVELADALTQVELANGEIAELNQKLKSDNLRMKAELDVTRRLQQMVLPNLHELNQLPELEIAAFMQPAEEVGGDYYDVLRQADGNLKVSIGDVTGHGLESGVVMLMVQMAMRTLIDHNKTELIEIIPAINRTIYNNVQRMGSDKNMTLILLDYQPGIGRLRLVGQHEEMVLVHSSPDSERTTLIETVDTMGLGFPVGLVEEIGEYMKVTEYFLKPGDSIILYTDGITEAENQTKKQYGQERLLAVIQQHHTESAAQIKEAIIADVLKFIGPEQPSADDITLVVLQRRRLPEVIELV